MQNILITGCYGGMGLSTTKRLIKEGYNVIGFDLKEKEKIDGLSFYSVDITKEESILKAQKEIKARGIKLDAIIHLAGIYDLNSLIEMNEEDYHRIFDINVFGVFRINKAFIDLLNENSKIIITTSELATLDPLPFTGVYAITKSALDKYAYSLRMELQLLGHQVVILRPGAVDTGLLNVSLDRLNKFKETTTHYEYNAAKFLEVVNKVEARKISPDKIANLINKILRKKKAKYVYKINRNPLLRMLNILPKRTQNKIIKKVISK